MTLSLNEAMKKPTIQKTILALLVLPMVCLAGCSEASEKAALERQDRTPEVVNPESHRDLDDYLEARNLAWETIDQGIPAFILGKLPEDLDRVPRVQDKKRIFFLSILPMVLLINDEITEQRAKLTAIFDRHNAALPSTEEELWTLATLARLYGVKGDDLLAPRAQKELLESVDIIPPSMALAQAASESAYGTSRFARQANNLFGEWTFTPGTGLVPAGRPEGEIYEVRCFPGLLDSVRSYMRNINTHRAYLPLRTQRAQLRKSGAPLEGRLLAGGLLRYSTRGEAYVEDIRAIIRQNRLFRLASATLRQSAVSDDGGRELLSSAEMLPSPTPL